MADLLTTIETEFEALLMSIQGQEVEADYTFYTKTGSVNVEDAALAEGLANAAGIEHPVSYLFDVDEDEGETILESSKGFDSYQCQTRYKLDARVENNGDALSQVNPKKAIKARMNEVVSDIKQLLWENDTLNKNVFRIIIAGWTRNYIKNGDQVNTGKVTFILNIEYGQNGSNPNLRACEF